jgi:hypothetical protein
MSMFRMMITVLDRLPITASLLKRTKIGKAVNKILKHQVFDEETNRLTADLVNKWKKLVKEYKEQEKDQDDQKSKVAPNYSNYSG